MSENDIPWFVTGNFRKLSIFNFKIFLSTCRWPAFRRLRCFCRWRAKVCGRAKRGWGKKDCLIAVQLVAILFLNARIPRAQCPEFLGHAPIKDERHGCISLSDEFKRFKGCNLQWTLWNSRRRISTVIAAANSCRRHGRAASERATTTIIKQCQRSSDKIVITLTHHLRTAPSNTSGNTLER